MATDDTHAGLDASAEQQKGGLPMLLQGDPTTDPTLDFLSPSFDPSKALATKGLQPPVTARPLDNVAACRRLLPAEMPESLCNNKKLASEACRLKHEQIKAKTKRDLDRIQQSYNVSLKGVMDSVPGNSPLSALREWQLQGATVRVVTRHAAGVRGVATGTLVAYDMFMNLLLRDVTESYTVLVRVWKDKSAPAVDADQAATTTTTTSCAQHVSGVKGRWVRRQEARQRSLGQVMVKGDSVVSVSCEPNKPTADITCSGSMVGQIHGHMCDDPNRLEGFGGL